MSLDNDQLPLHASSILTSPAVNATQPLSQWNHTSTLHPSEYEVTTFQTTIAALPAAVAATILLLYALALLLQPVRPQWTRRFITEPYLPAAFASKRLPNAWRYSLLAVSLGALTLQIPQAILAAHSFVAISPACAWAVAIFLIAIDRPQTPPLSLLLLYISLFISSLFRLLSSPTRITAADIPLILDATAGLTTIILLLTKSLRHPRLPTDGIADPSEPPTSTLRSPEDNLTPWQWMTVSWMSGLISLGAQRQLNEDDVWDLPYEFQHRRLHDAFRSLRGSVIRRLLVANGIDLAITTLLGIIEMVANLSAPALLQQILRAMSDPDAPASAPITWAMLALLVRLAAAQSSVFSTWFSRRAYERARGEMITMLYEKTLRRKIAGSAPVRGGDDEEAEEGEGRKPEDELLLELEVEGDEFDTAAAAAATEARRRWWEKAGRWVGKLFGRAQHGEPLPRRRTREKQPPASTGKILNLMRNDVYEVAQRFWEFPNLVTKPLGLIFAVFLVWRLVGWPCLLGIVTVVVAQLVGGGCAKVMVAYERRRRAATDRKLQKVGELVEAIRHLRWYGWQDFWLADIMRARQHELHLRVVVGVWSNAIMVLTHYSIGLFPVAAFWAYAALAGRPLHVDVIFPALDLFNMLSENLRQIPDLITVLLNASVAMGRIESFMQEPEKEEPETTGLATDGEDDTLELQHASFAWPGSSSLVLDDITLSFPTGLTVIYGAVASGKTALFQAMLGELDLRRGHIQPPPSRAPIAYCAQTPWLQSMSIRENILFGAGWDAVRYAATLDACALRADLARFTHGDRANVGENGVGLSGGQKARVALARAVYSRARLVFLDDPLSALDQPTAAHVVRKCLAGPLMAGRTVVLVTHRTDLCHGLARQWVEMNGGHARVVEPSQIPAAFSQAAPDPVEEEAPPSADTTAAAEGVPDKFIEDEHRAHGDVQARVYWEYIKAGGLTLWVLLVLENILFRLLDVAQTWFIKEWGEAYNTSSSSSSASTISPSSSSSSTTLLHRLLSHLPPPGTNVHPWLLTFLGFATAISGAFLVARALMLLLVYRAGRRMFAAVLGRVSGARFRFYDATPVGRLMNRLTSDVNTIDGDVGGVVQAVAFYAVTWVSSVVVIGSIAPAFLVAAVGLTGAFWGVFRRFLGCSGGLRRLEMVSLSPLMSNFGALVDGLTTVRAFHAQPSFQAAVITVTDRFQRMDHFYWALQAWLTYRFDALSALSTFLLTLLALYTNVTPGLTAFALLAASKFVTATHLLCRFYAQLQMDFVSVERVVEMLHLEQEPAGTVVPPAHWPSTTGRPGSGGGDIVFDHVTIRYAPHLPPALDDVSFRIPGGSCAAVVGRTGSGKSTLALALLGAVTPESGRVLIDGVDVATVNKQVLRRRITFLPQDPHLFPGTLASNLDPLSQHPPAAIAAALAHVGGARFGWTPCTPVAAGGKGLSQGQRQLVGLARALLRASAVVVMDEATASVDVRTAGRMEGLVREMVEGGGRTVVGVVHRRGEGGDGGEGVGVRGRGRGRVWEVRLVGGKVGGVGWVGGEGDGVEGSE